MKNHRFYIIAATSRSCSIFKKKFHLDSKLIYKTRRKLRFFPNRALENTHRLKQRVKKTVVEMLKKLLLFLALHSLLWFSGANGVVLRSSLLRCKNWAGIIVPDLKNNAALKHLSRYSSPFTSVTVGLISSTRFSRQSFKFSEKNSSAKY